MCHFIISCVHCTLSAAQRLNGALTPCPAWPLLAADDLETRPQPTGPAKHYTRYCPFRDPTTGTRCSVLLQNHDAIAMHCR